MIKLILFIFVCTVISSSFSQEIYPSLLSPKTDSDNSQTWHFQNYQEPQRKSAKPCPKRRSFNDDGPQWLPFYTSKVSNPAFPPPVLEPQALKNEYPELSKDESKSYLSDAKVNKLSHSEVQLASMANMNPSDVNDEDCEERNQNSERPSVTHDPGHTAVKLIKDCLDKKHRQKEALEQSPKSPSDHMNVFSRRSMSEIDPDDSGYLQDDEGETIASAKNAKVNSTDIITGSRRYTNTITELGEPLRNNQNHRICYACSTATNPSCWDPDHSTTIKYCTIEQSCVTKTLGVKNSLALIRDCANTCESSAVPGIEPKFKSCKLCHTDYCNGASSISVYIYNFAIVVIIGITKCYFDF